MILSAAPVSDETHVVCDWFELAVLCSEFSTYAFETLAREWDTRRNSEDKDPEGSDRTAENFILTVQTEIQARSELLGDSYPFRFSLSGESLEFDEATTGCGGWIYIFCLVLSYPKQGAIFDGRYLPPIDNAVRNYFQACATFAAAGEIQGNSFAFGFPRPDGSGFLAKLREIYVSFGENSAVVEIIPPGAPKAQKDAQIDIIAWSPTLDGAAGKRYLLGQVASGENWQNKTIKGGPIDSFHNVWFSRSPASQAIASIFTPFCYGNLIDDSNHDVICHHTYEFGHIFYRFKIPPLAQRGIELAATGLVVERLSDFDNIKRWVSEQIVEMRRDVR